MKRLDAVGEEVLLTMQKGGEDERRSRRSLFAVARKQGGTAMLEFIAGRGEGGNLQDQVALLGTHGEDAQLKREVSLHLLRHLAASVRHQQSHDTDFVIIRVNPPKPSGITLA